MPGAIYETGFWLIIYVVYIYFSDLSSALTHRGVSMQWGGLSYSFPDATIMCGICLSILCIRRFYYNYMDRFPNLNAFKRVEWFLKINRLTVKTLHIPFIAPNIRHIIKQNFIQFSYSNFSYSVAPGNESKYSLRPIKRSAYRLTFKPRGFLIPWRIERSFFNRKFTGK